MQNGVGWTASGENVPWWAVRLFVLEDIPFFCHSMRGSLSALNSYSSHSRIHSLYRDKRRHSRYKMAPSLTLSQPLLVLSLADIVAKEGGEEETSDLEDIL